MAESEDLGGRGCLFTFAFAVAAVAAFLVIKSDSSIVAAVVVFFVVGIMYSLLAAVVVSICRGLRTLSFPDDKSSWDHDTAAGWGAVWPLSLAFWLLITPFFAVINRLFRKSV